MPSSNTLKEIALRQALHALPVNDENPGIRALVGDILRSLYAAAYREGYADGDASRSFKNTNLKKHSKFIFGEEKP